MKLIIGIILLGISILSFYGHYRTKEKYKHTVIPVNMLFSAIASLIFAALLTLSFFGFEAKNPRDPVRIIKSEGYEESLRKRD